MGHLTGVLLASVLLAVLPAAGLVVYYYRQDRFRDEPKASVLLVFFAGGLSTLAAYWLERGLDGALHRLVAPARWPYLFAALEAFVVAGLVEESLKLLTVRLTVYGRPQFDEVTDGIVYTIVASLGFALLEDLHYFYLLGDPTTLLVRAFTAVPMHAFMSGLMGYEIGLSRFAATARERRAHMLRGLCLAAFLHGCYDFFIMSGVGGLVVLIFPLLVLGFLLLRGRFQTALAFDYQRLGAARAARRTWGLPGLAGARRMAGAVGYEGVPWMVRQTANATPPHARSGERDGEGRSTREDG